MPTTPPPLWFMILISNRIGTRHSDREAHPTCAGGHGCGRVVAEGKATGQLERLPLQAHEGIVDEATPSDRGRRGRAPLARLSDGRAISKHVKQGDG